MKKENEADNRIYFLLTKAVNAMTAHIRQQFLKAGLKVTPAQLGILFILKNGNSRTMTELSQELGTDNSAVTRAVDRLEKAGLVERNSSPDDRREYRITITGSGVDETESVKKVIAAINKKITDEFSPAELDDFRKTLVKMFSLFSA